MKNILFYGFIMILIVVVLPLLIVGPDEYTSLPEGPSVIHENKAENKDDSKVGIKDEDKSQSKDSPKTSKKSVKLNVYVANEKVTKEMELEEYVKGVVAAEMPGDFGIEALKAQAVAARTYALGRMEKLYTAEKDTHSDADICTDSNHCQAWVSKESAMEGWGTLTAYSKWSKIEKAVNETKDEIITYDGKTINPLFHSNSGGKTENSEEVWAGVSVPYLRSVESSGEEEYKDYKTEVIVKAKDFYDTLKKHYPKIKLNTKNIMSNIGKPTLTEGGRVKEIKIGNVKIKGTEFRTMFSLKSANFKISEYNGGIKISVRGNGHGVGMSQWGANYLAKSGGTYAEIIKYYYKGVELEKIKN